MVRVEKSKIVSAVQEKIFALITDFEKLPERVSEQVPLDQGDR